MFTIYQNKLCFRGWTIGEINPDLPAHVRLELEAALEKVEEKGPTLSPKNPRARPVAIMNEMNELWGKET